MPLFHQMLQMKLLTHLASHTLLLLSCSAVFLYHRVTQRRFRLPPIVIGTGNTAPVSHNANSGCRPYHFFSICHTIPVLFFFSTPVITSALLYSSHPPADCSQPSSSFPSSCSSTCCCCCWPWLRSSSGLPCPCSSSAAGCTRTTAPATSSPSAPSSSTLAWPPLT